MDEKFIASANAEPIPPMQPTKVSKPVRKRRADEGFIANLCRWIVDHQIGIAVNLLLLLCMAHLSFPKARQHTRKFFAMSYHDESNGRYSVGWDDMYSVIFYITVFTGLRIIIMDYVFTPLARVFGIMKPKERVRFAEQAWILLYYTVSFTLGMYIMSREKYWFNFEYMWEGWPDRQMNGLFKWYYIMQFAFWLQSIFVLNIEEHRKDHAQMLTHHFVTCALMFSSYGYHHYRIGNVILCIMDTVDLIFPLAKMLKYAGYSTACDIAFGCFMVLWFVSRHVFYPMAVWSIYRDLPKHTKFGCYSGNNSNLRGPFPPPEGYDYLISPFRDPEGTVCHTEAIQYIFIGLLLFLQGILIVWFFMIIRLAIRVLKGQSADDPRSDDEEEDEMAMEDVENETYQRVSPEELQRSYDLQAKNMTRKPSPSQRTRRAHANASGISLPSDRKELLGRIGCDKQD